MIISAKNASCLLDEAKIYDERLIGEDHKDRLELALENMGVKDGNLYNEVFLDYVTKLLHNCEPKGYVPSFK